MDRIVVFNNLEGGLLLHTDAWTLSKCNLQPPEVDKKVIQIAGSSAPLDLTDALTPPTYKQRPLNLTLECSEQNRAYRNGLIRELLKLNPKRLRICLPDFETGYYLIGRIKINVDKNNIAHAIVDISAECDPFIYAPDSVNEYELAETETAVQISSAGDMTVAVTAVVSDTVNIRFTDSGEEHTYSLSAGTHLLPALIVGDTDRTIYISGSGTVQFCHKVGVLFW